MTRERALDLAYDALLKFNPVMGGGSGAREIADTILAAVAEEREACAQIADEFDPTSFREDPVPAVEWLAAKIRERK